MLDTSFTPLTSLTNINTLLAINLKIPDIKRRVSILYPKKGGKNLTRYPPSVAPENMATPFTTLK
jgi:hypothetical protein